ncbi:aspartyl protease family protein [Pedobacter aquatilis]|uniref:aspartyl protease family protein n=1 Tax=Pedobacter aquatilis TaxID=351343 RepID=UPI00292E4F9C|nr:aspartyl protease family protein [Pedobacter aquatilis]
MKKIVILIASAFLLSTTSLAQNIQIDSLRFSTEKGLLIFEGYLNGIKTDFAFDTGAGSGVLTSKSLRSPGISMQGHRKINDSQQNVAKLGLAKINSLKIGAFDFLNITSVLSDMPFLYCNDVYLLGGDVINQLNWKFDFEKNIVYFSKQPFAMHAGMQEMPFRIVGNRHFSTLLAQGQYIENVLIDFGFAGFCTLESTSSKTRQIMRTLSPEGIYPSKSSSMGLNSMSVGKMTNSFFLDSVRLGGLPINDLKVNAMPDTHDKIGLLLLKRNFKQIIINSLELKYWLLPNSVLPARQTSFDASFHLNDKRQLEVVSMNGSLKNTAESLKIGQRLIELNGRRGESFANKCEFLSWYAEQAKNDQFTILTTKGETLIIGRSIF